jgi:ribosomal protein L22
MSPDKSSDPNKIPPTAPDEEKVAAEAAEAKEEAAVEAAAEQVDEAPAEEKPKPKRASRAKKPAEPKAEEEAPGDQEAPVEEEAPAEEPVAEEEAPVEEPVAAEKPKRASRAKKPAEPKAEEKPAKAKPEPTANGKRPVVRAQAKYVRTSARKARLVCDHIRGKSVDEARAILAHTPRAVAEDWQKLLESAVANAEHNHELVGDDLKIVAVFADEGPTLKRFRPRAMGRATRIRKRTSHLTIQLTPKD